MELEKIDNAINFIDSLMCQEDTRSLFYDKYNNVYEILCELRERQQPHD